METRFVATPWRSRQELLEVRRDLFGEDVQAKRRAVEKVFAWRNRKLELPLLLESTADIVDATVQDDMGVLDVSAVRLVYGIAVSRFITGLADTQTELTRLRPSFFPPGTSKPLQFPLALRETRHCIVHRHMPSLAELKRAATQSLAWLWEWYWSHLDAAFAVDSTTTTTATSSSSKEMLTEREVKERLQGVLKTYVRARKMEIRSRGRGTGKGGEVEKKAAQAAVASVLYVEARSKYDILLDLLIAEKAILPADKKIGSSMSGAFVIWTPFLAALCTVAPVWLTAFLDALVGYMGAATSVSQAGGFGSGDVEDDPVREGMHDWAVHVLLSKEWEGVRGQGVMADMGGSGDDAARTLVTHVLDQIFLTPSFWTLKLAADILKKDERVVGREAWLKILEAAREEEDAEMDGGEHAGHVASVPDVEAKCEKGDEETMALDSPPQKLRGPQKMVGIWRPQPIGTIPPGWEHT
ncbi:Las1-domain-containing protein [Periconia macrospinosa]|uniref:Las1-domain-containing protein n=1 Tax=Periconia macrospinosa TaxID=97972 RepID=A0A2V1DTL7_9PLEO|nr:Las1-domain-containing protein [Periconia macrospinosa]